MIRGPPPANPDQIDALQRIYVVFGDKLAPLNAGSAVKWMPGFTRMVHVLPPSVIVGIAVAVFSANRDGEAKIVPFCADPSNRRLDLILRDIVVPALRIEGLDICRRDVQNLVAVGGGGRFREVDGHKQDDEVQNFRIEVFPKERRRRPASIVVLPTKRALEVSLQPVRPCP